MMKVKAGSDFPKTTRPANCNQDLSSDSFTTKPALNPLLYFDVYPYLVLPSKLKSQNKTFKTEKNKSYVKQLSNTNENENFV